MTNLRPLSLSFIIQLAFLTLVFSKSLPSELPTTINKYELRRPLRFSYFRLNSKLELNPIIGHIPRAKSFCSSKLGPHCEPINSQVLQEYVLMEEKLTDVEKNAYIVQKYYQPTRFEITQEIEKKTYGYFLIPSNEYKLLDEVVKRSVKSQMHEEEQSFYIDSKKKEATNSQVKNEQKK